MANSGTESGARLSWQQVRYIFKDWRIYLYVIIVVGNLGAIQCLTLFLPSLVAGMSESNSLTHLLTASPYVSACLCCLIGGYSSSRRNEHGFHLEFFLFIALVGFILMAILADRGKVGIYISSCIACSGIYAAFPILLSWLTKNIGGHTKRAMAVCCFMTIGQLGGTLAFQVYRDDDKPTYRRGHLICGGTMMITLIVTFILRFCLKTENYRRTHLSLNEYNREAAIKEPCDWHPDVRYVL